MISGIRLKECPAEGEGVHRWIFHAACTLTDAGVSADSAAEIIEELMTRPPKPWSEVDDALRSARGERKAGPRWTPAIPNCIVEVVKAGPSLAELISRSPQPIHLGQPSHTEKYIDALFPGDPWLLDKQAALLWHLAQFAPLALVVFSGGKSAHSWFFCEGPAEDKLTRFFDYATSLGADPKTWSRSQFVRIPDGERSDGKTGEGLSAAGVVGVPEGRQAVLYFNLEVIR